MRSIVTLMLLAPALMFAVSLQPVTVLPDDGKVLPSSPQTGSGRAARPGLPSVRLIRSVAQPMTGARTVRH